MYNEPVLPMESIPLEKRVARADLENKVEEFLAKGGKIDKVDIRVGDGPTSRKHFYNGKPKAS